MDIKQAMALAILGLENLIELDKQQNPRGSSLQHDVKQAIKLIKCLKNVKSAYKRLAAKELLKKYPMWSFREIGRQVELSHTTIARIWYEVEQGARR